jgi:pimeloyl-ACP methyl ester carboxylesterase
MWRWYEREQAAVSPDFVLRAVRLLAGADLSARLGALRVPVLLLHGDSSPFIPVAVMADLRTRLPDAGCRCSRMRSMACRFLMRRRARRRCGVFG